MSFNHVSSRIVLPKRRCTAPISLWALPLLGCSFSNHDPWNSHLVHLTSAYRTNLWCELEPCLILHSRKERYIAPIILEVSHLKELQQQVLYGDYTFDPMKLIVGNKSCDCHAWPQQLNPWSYPNFICRCLLWQTVLPRERCTAPSSNQRCYPNLWC